MLLIFLSLLLPVYADSWSKLGCYSSISVAESKGSYMYQSSGYCEQQCAGYRVAALKNGNECYCGDVDPTSQSNGCNIKCSGWPLDTCGGSSAYMVYINADADSQAQSSSTSSTSTSSTSSSKSTSSSSSSTSSSSTSTEQPSTTTIQATTTEQTTAEPESTEQPETTEKQETTSSSRTTTQPRTTTVVSTSVQNGTPSVVYKTIVATPSSNPSTSFSSSSSSSSSTTPPSTSTSSSSSETGSNDKGKTNPNRRFQEAQ